MKAKRFLSFVVSLSLAVSLAAPALAEEGESYGEFIERFYTEYAQQNPEEYAAFDPHAWFEEDWGDYWESEEEFIRHMVDMGYWDDADQFSWEMWGDYLSGKADEAWYAQEQETYRAAHPGELEKLTAEELLARKGYTETLTPTEQFMADWGLESEEEVLPALLREYVSNRLWIEETHATAPAYRERYPDQWAEFDPNARFAELYPGMDLEEYKNTRDFFTQEEFADTMFVEYAENYLIAGGDDEGEEGWYWDGQDYERLITLYVNGQPVDTDVTADDGVTYADPAVLGEILGTQLSGSAPVSIRSAAEAAGWDVTWNSYRRQVVLLDRERLLTGVVVPGLGWVEEDISGLDRLAEKARTVSAQEPGQSYQTTGTVDIAYTALNSLDGDETYTAKLKVETLTRDKSCEISLSMDLADLLGLLPKEVLEEAKAQLPKTARDLKTLLKGLKVDLIWDGETGTLYVNAPIVALVDPTPGVDGDAWYAFDLPELLEAETGTASVPEALYESLLERSETGWAGAGDAYSDFMMEKGLFHILFGPHAVTEKNGTLTWKLDGEMISAAVDAFMGAIGEPGNWDDASLFKECRLEMTMDAKSNTSFDMVFRPDVEGITAAIYDSDYSLMGGLFAWRLLGMTDFRMAASGQNSAKGGKADLEFHWKNGFKLALDMETTRKEVRTAPRTTPPDGAEIVKAR